MLTAASLSLFRLFSFEVIVGGSRQHEALKANDNQCSKQNLLWRIKKWKQDAADVVADDVVASTREMTFFLLSRKWSNMLSATTPSSSETFLLLSSISGNGVSAVTETTFSLQILVCPSTPLYAQHPIPTR